MYGQGIERPTPGNKSGQLSHNGKAAMNSLLLGLAPDKVYMPFAVAGNAAGSYPAISVLTPFVEDKKSGLFSVAPLCPCGSLTRRKVSCPVVPGLSSGAAYGECATATARSSA